MFFPLLNVLIAFDKSYGSNGDQILHTHSGIVEFFRYVDYQPQVMFDQRGFLPAVPVLLKDCVLLPTPPPDSRAVEGSRNLLYNGFLLSGARNILLNLGTTFNWI